jgi:hypothetical protein
LFESGCCGNFVSMKIIKNWGWSDYRIIALWLGIFFLTHSFMSGADHFLALTPEAMGKYFSYKWILIAHITAGGGALVLGPFQFWKRLQQGNWKVHRVIGVLYLLAVLVSSVCAVILAYTTAYAINWAYAFSLQVWVSVWIIATFIAYGSALTKRFKLHKEWMTRSYIVTVAFIVSGLMVKLPLIQQLGSFAEISPSLFWFGWSVPLFVYEVVLAAKRKN